MNRFRCQYQKKGKCISDSIEKETPITSIQIIVSLCRLATKVRNEVSKKAGEKVALQVLKIHEHIIRDVHGKNNIGHGPTHSYFLNKKNNERVDIEFYGEYGANDKDNPINKYIYYYKKTKGWQ